MKDTFCTGVRFNDAGQPIDIQFKFIDDDDLPRPAGLTTGTFVLPSITVDPTGRVTYATGLPAGTYYSFTVNADQSLTPSTTPPTGGATRLITHSTTVGNDTGTGKTDLYSDTLPANTLSVNGMVIEGVYAGAIVATGKDTREATVAFAGNTLFDSGALTPSGDTKWEIQFSLIRVSSSVLRYSVTMSAPGSTSGAKAGQGSYSDGGELTGLDFTATNILKVTGESAGGAPANNDIIASMAYATLYST